MLLSLFQGLARRSVPALALLAMLALHGCGGGGGGTTATVSVPATAAVTAYSQTLSTTKNNPISITLQGSSASAATLMFDVYTQPVHGTLTGQLSGIAPVMTYTPGLDFYGSDSFTFHVTDAQGNTGTGTITIQVLNSISPLADSDGDGLLDLNELNIYGTNPNLADTDADGFSDFDEVVTYGFDRNVNNFRFNPLLADMPEIDIRLVSQPEIQLNYTTTSGSSTTISTNRSATSSTSTSHSKAYTSTWSSSVSHEAGISLTVGVEEDLNFGSSGVDSATKWSASATTSYTNTNTEGHEKSTSWDDTTTHENSSTYDQGNSFEQNNAISTSDGDILVSAKVVNTGHIAYTLNNLYLNAAYFDGTNKQPYTPIGSLHFDGAGGGFPTVTLAPGQSTGVLTFRTSPLNINAVKKLLRDSRGMSIRPSIYDMTDPNGVPYNFASTGIATQTALVKIDYVGNGGRQNITKRVAVHADPNGVVNVAKALNDILKISVVVADAYGNPSTQGFIQSVDGLANRDPYGFWVMIHGQSQGNNRMVTTTYTTPQDRQRWIARGNLDPYTTSIVDSVDLSQVQLHGGDTLHLFYMQDSDLDGLPDVQEFFYRSDPLVPDTDHDGLDDSIEVKGWDVTWENKVHSIVTRRVYSSPTLADTDADGLADAEEANLQDSYSYNRRNPRTGDTDGDGIADGVDDKNGVLLGRNMFQNLSISDLYTSVQQVAGQNANVTVTYTLPASLYQMPGNGYSSFAVAIYRLVDANANFPAPAHPPLDGVMPLLGDTLPCGAGSACTWQAVHVYQTAAGAANQPATAGVQNAFTETALLPANTSAKYLAYVSVDGKWRADTSGAQASSNSEIIRFTMHDGWIANLKTIVGPTQQADTSGNWTVRHDSADPAILYWYWNDRIDCRVWAAGWAGGVLYVPNDSRCAANAPQRVMGLYQRYEAGSGAHLNTWGGDFVYVAPYNRYYTDTAGKVIDDLPVDYWEPPMVYPYVRGDGQVDIFWSLKVDGIALHDSPAAQTVDNTFQANGGVPSPAGMIPSTGGTPIFSGASSVLLNGAPAGTPATGVFEIELPAVQQCHTVWLGVHEADANLPNGLNPRANGDTDLVADLCRDASPAGSGVWTLKNHATGAVLGSTRKGNAFPVSFSGHANWHVHPPANQSVSWKTQSWHAVSKQFDLNIGYDMTVR